MKEAESSFDILASAKELQAIVGARVEKIYHPKHDHVVLALRMPQEGKNFLHFHVGRWIYASSEPQEMPQKPSDFAMMLRKRITDARIESVRQPGFERIVVLSLEKDGRYELVLELFGDGNVILVKEGVIVQPLTSHTWKHRDVRARKPFELPPPVPDPSAMTDGDLLGILRSSDTDLVRTLATRLNLGGRYSEEVLARSGRDKSAKAAEVGLDDAKAILDAINGLRREIMESTVGVIVTRNGSLEDVVPARMRIYSGDPQEEFPTFSDAVREYVSRMPPPARPREERGSGELERMKRKIAQQEAGAMRLQDEARELQILGDFIFANYERVSKALTDASGAAGDAAAMKSIQGFQSFDPSTSTIRVRVGDVALDLDVKGTVESNAQRYYEKAKRARKKLEGLLSAMQEARKEAEREETKAAAEEARKAPKHRPTKRFWFERFRWFISSEGAVVLGGKDAKSNDMLVKKHLQAGDRYAHADIHGAPSVVVKMKEGVTEKTLAEACEFAVATSRAWNAKIGSAAGYWVLPEQVSKTPQSGEYLAKGAFVIRGKRNYSEKTDIRLAVGEIEIEGSRKVMCGPADAVRAHSRRYIVIQPGEEDKNAFAKKLSDAFQVPIEEIQSILPPGDVRIVEQVGLSIS